MADDRTEAEPAGQPRLERGARARALARKVPLEAIAATIGGFPKPETPMAMETTLVLVKPDGVQRGLVGAVLSRLESKGLQIVGLKMLQASRELLETHYAVHRERPFFAGLLKFMASAPVVALAVRGDGAIETVRRMMGPTNGAEAPAGTIRGDYGMSRSFNLVHGSDGPESARTELALWFGDELLDYSLDRLAWVYDPED